MALWELFHPYKWSHKPRGPTDRTPHHVEVPKTRQTPHESLGTFWKSEVFHAAEHFC